MASADPQSPTSTLEAAHIPAWTGEGKPVPVISLGSRAIPAWCALARLEGEAELLDSTRWPGIEACEACYFFRGRTELELHCAAPGVSRRHEGLSLEVDVFRRDGRKRRSFVDLSGDLRAAVLKQLRWPGASPVEVVDLKFVQGDARALTDESHAYMERWRFYWNGDGWKRKPPGSSLHDWNKWGPQLEHLSASEPGGKPPRDGWPPVLDLPVGHYLLRVVSLDWRSGRRDEPELEWVLRLLDGEGAGRRVFRRAPVRSPRMVQLVKRDVGRLLEVSPQTVPEPTDPAFEAFRQRVLGVAVRARVASRGAYTNLYFEGRAAGSGPSPE